MQQVSEEMPPCRFCGSKCRVENFNSERVEATLWICGNNEYFGGDCPDQTAYLYEHAWQAAMRSKDHSIAGDDVRERVKQIILDCTDADGNDANYAAQQIITAIGSQSIEGERA